MIAAVYPPPASSGRLAEASALALRLVQTENALRALTSGQADAIVDADGRTYLLHPAQEHLRKREGWLEAVLESAADVITVVNRSGEIVSQSRAALRLFGYESGKLVGRSLFSLIHPDDLPRLYAAFFNVIDEFRPNAVVEFRHETSDGGHCVVEATISKLRHVTAASIVLICRDTSWRESAQEDAVRREAVLTEALKAKDRLLAVIAHELRTPLMPAFLGLDLLEEDERLAEARPTFALIRRNLELQARLLEELTDFTRVGQQKVRLRLEPIDAHEAVRFVLEICQSEITAARFGVLLDLQAAESTVQADSVRLQQVMWNLLRNAIKFSTPGSSISITSANDAAGRIVLAFTDYGIGIAAEFLPRVFDPFEQADHAAHEHASGLGLGLGMFIAKGLAEAQQATLSVASAGRGQGTTFRLTFKTIPMMKPENPIYVTKP